MREKEDDKRIKYITKIEFVDFLYIVHNSNGLSKLSYKGNLTN